MHAVFFGTKIGTKLTMVNCSLAQRVTALHSFLVKFIIYIVSNSEQSRNNTVQKIMDGVNMFSLCLMYNAFILISTMKVKNLSDNNIH